jgi:hypothetical protein
MPSFEENLRKAYSYVGTNFFESYSIGVIARGPSNLKLSLCSDKFNHCFLAGEFNKTLDTIGSSLVGKDVVMCLMQPMRYRTSPENCKKYNIRNLQVSIRENTDNFNRAKRGYRDINVVGYTNEHCLLSEKIFTYGNKGIYSTGIAAIFHAIYFKPKEIYIIGLDFYDEGCSQYGITEKHDILNEHSQETCIRSMREGMIHNLYSIVSYCENIQFYLYTTFFKLEGQDRYKNLHIFRA